MIKFGAHFPVAETISSALPYFERYGCNSTQIFVHSPYSYFLPKGVAWSPEDMANFKEATKGKEVVVHACFMINLASPKPQIFGVSKKSLIEDAKIAVQLGAKYLVFHTGSYTKDSTLEGGIGQIARGIATVLSYVPGIILLMENTAGKGTAVGNNLINQLKIIDEVPQELRHRVGICLDTAHAWAAGYDVSNVCPADWLDEAVLNRIRVVHFNMPDAGILLDSGRDRHRCRMTEGAFPAECMEVLLHVFKDKVLIMERPASETSAGMDLSGDKEGDNMDSTVLESDFKLLKEWIGKLNGTQGPDSPEAGNVIA